MYREEKLLGIVKKRRPCAHPQKAHFHDVGDIHMYCTISVSLDTDAVRFSMLAKFGCITFQLCGKRESTGLIVTELCPFWKTCREDLFVGAHETVCLSSVLEGPTVTCTVRHAVHTFVCVKMLIVSTN